MKVGNVEEVRAYAAEFLSTLSKGARACVVSLSGGLGAGKTAFAQAVAHMLGVEEVVTSPTFVIENIYALSGQKWKRLVHIDAYRLKNGGELCALGWDEIAADPANLIILEWPERVTEVIPEDAINLTFDIDGEGRIITLSKKYGNKEEKK